MIYNKPFQIFDIYIDTDQFNHQFTHGSTNLTSTVMGDWIVIQTNGIPFNIFLSEVDTITIHGFDLAMYLSEISLASS